MEQLYLSFVFAALELASSWITSALVLFVVVGVAAAAVVDAVVLAVDAAEADIILLFVFLRSVKVFVLTQEICLVHQRDGILRI